MNKKPIIVLLIATVVFCFLRDMQHEKQYTSDLRNRVVGARLEKDGLLPYFYKWKPENNLRYYDPANFDSFKVSNITATPFFHQLLYPLAELPQRTISVIWLYIQYLLFIGCIVMALLLCKNKSQQLITVVVAVGFLFSDAWILHIANGQIYILVPFIGILFYLCFKNNSKLLYALVAGISAAVLLFIRPTCMFFFLPFMLLIPSLKLKNIIALTIPFLLLSAYTVLNQQQRNLWIDYKGGMEEQYKQHQGLKATMQNNYPKIIYKNWEGWNVDEIAVNNKIRPLQVQSESGNVFVLLEKTTHKKVPYSLISVSFFALILVLIVLFFRSQKRESSFSIIQIAVFGFCLYMMSDFFSPIHRHQYYTIQWLFPLLLMASVYNKNENKYWVFLLLGLLLNIVSIRTFKGLHALGEYIILSTLLIWCLRKKKMEFQ
jgi:hypothetical protein